MTTTIVERKDEESEIVQRAITTGATPQRIGSFNRARRLLLIHNDGTGTDKVGIGGSGVSSTLHHPIGAQGGLVLDVKGGCRAEWWVIAITGTPTVRVTEVVPYRDGIV